MQNIWRCPVCSLPLISNGASLKCDRGHNYDISRGGYVNLLVGATKGVHGDNHIMTEARKRFLLGGYYFPLLDSVCRAAEELFPEKGIALDAGCGEGYYTNGVCSYLSRLGREARFYGIDISKDMIKSASGLPCAKEGKMSFAVASVYDIPVPDASIDLILDIFSPQAMQEYTRILKEKGTLILAVPERRHLWELKEVLYDTPYENEVHDTELPGYELLCNIPVSFRFRLDSNEDIMSLYAMTPYYYRTTQEGTKRLRETNTLDITADFRVLGYKLI